MRIIAIILFLIAAPPEIYSQSVSFGGGFIYGDDIKEPGINLRAYYNLPGNRVCFGPEYSTFLTHKEEIDGEDIKIDLYELNFNGHFIFEVTHKFAVYPFTGLNFSREKEEIEISGTIKTHTQKEFGLNLGFGAHYAYYDFAFFAEFGHLFSDLSQNSITIGVFYTLGKKSESEDE